MSCWARTSSHWQAKSLAACSSMLCCAEPQPCSCCLYVPCTQELMHGSSTKKNMLLCQACACHHGLHDGSSCIGPCVGILPQQCLCRAPSRSPVQTCKCTWSRSFATKISGLRLATLPNRPRSNGTTGSLSLTAHISEMHPGKPVLSQTSLTDGPVYRHAAKYAACSLCQHVSAEDVLRLACWRHSCCASSPASSLAAVMMQWICSMVHALHHMPTMPS